MAKAKEGKVDAGYFKNMDIKEKKQKKYGVHQEFMKENLNLIKLVDGS